MNTERIRVAKNILWFAPTAGLWASAELENDLANAWAQSGHQVTIIRCRGVLNTYCPVMTAESIAPNASAKTKEIACTECRFNSSLLDQPQFALYSTLWLDDFVTKDMRNFALETIASINMDNWHALQIGGIPIGRYSSYSTLLHHKIPSPSASDLAWQEYQSDLFNSLLVLQAMSEILGAVDPELVVVYNPLYPINRIFSEYASLRSIPLVSVTAGGFTPDRYSSIALYPRIYSGQTARDSASISSGLDRPLSQEEISEVSRYVGHQMFGNDPWVYTSSPTELTTEEIRSHLGLRTTTPVVVVLVGSPDETRSSEIVDAERVRTDSELSQVLEFIAQALSVARVMPDIDFVIRLHPRLAANKREKYDSPDLIEIYQALEACPPNAHLNVPGDGIGLYDTARIASVGLNHASSAGLEFLLLGIPVVHYDPPRLNAYPPEFGSGVRRLDEQALADSLRQSIAEGWSIELSRRAYRWIATNLLRALVHRNPLHGAPVLKTDLQSQSPLNPKLSRMREAIPRSVRENVSRRIARKKRAADFTSMRLTQSTNTKWKDEANRRLNELEDVEIWEPLIIQRGVSLAPESEFVSIQNEVERIISQLGGMEITQSQRD